MTRKIQRQIFVLVNFFLFTTELSRRKEVQIRVEKAEKRKLPTCKRPEEEKEDKGRDGERRMYCGK